MENHRIYASVVSLANPWLDFMSERQGKELATDLNCDIQEFCEVNSGKSKDRELYAFGVLGACEHAVDSALRELERIKKASRLRGVILGSRGVRNRGLNDPAMIEVYQALEELGLFAFIHPHYGIAENQPFAGTGHSLALALGFPFETSVSISRLILSGMLDKVKNVKLLLAHSGGTLPWLAGRLDSCVETDLHVADKLEFAPSEYLKRFYYDSLCYHAPALKCLFDLVGTSQIFFGTDHPFFPPPEDSKDGLWKSTIENYRALEEFSEDIQYAVLENNARILLNLEF
jgi:predicted TIM-barrel fold metal-dependent hydrolase